ncbi:MAG: FecR domain-containing protein [Bacteroidales bacterium]|nr:FecR domain-containing protein [Bacteroidales bacterium]
MMKTFDDYKTGRVNPSEMDALADYVDSLTDEQLAAELARDWENFNPAGNMNAAKLRRMYPSSRIGGPASFATVFPKVAAAVLAVVTLSLSIVLYRESKVQDHLSDTTFTVSAGIDGPSQMTLPDGTLVRLNARSVLSYNSDFGRDERRISLVGEGFFDVAKDPDRRFIVETPNMEIAVFGTKFNVYAYPERSVDEMSLVEGSVSVNAGGNLFRLSPGEKVFFDKATGSTHITKTDNMMETAWLGQELSFNHATLSDVFDVLERRFGVTIKTGEGIDLSDRYTGSFTDRRIGDIMDVLKMHYHFNVTTDDNIIHITNQ